MRSVFVLSSLLVFAACGPRSGPSSALASYGDALKTKNYDRAYALMSEEYRSAHSKEEFIDLLKKNSKEVDETVRRIKGRAQRVEVFAEFQYGLGDGMRLVQEGGAWRIATNPAQFYSHASPREALRSFVRAYNAKRWDVMLSYVPREYRERMTSDMIRQQFDGDEKEQMSVMMVRLAAHLDSPISINGREARMPYADQYEVVFRREDGGWKIQDLDN